MHIFFFLLSLQNLYLTISLPFLCPKPLSNDDLNCTILNGNFLNPLSFSPSNASNNSQITIVNFNLDRNGGTDSTKLNFIEILERISKKTFLIASADILIITEIARDCQIYAEYTDGPLEIAKKFGLFYGYAVEYVENYQEGDEHQCTMGNAIFSKYPMQNLEQIRFRSQCCKYDNRWGGRVALVSDILINGRILTAYSTHLESGQDFFFSVIHGFIIRWQQINEIIEHSKEKTGNSDYFAIVGDLNAPFGSFDIVNFPLWFNGFEDSHSKFSFFERTTCPLGDLSIYGLFLFDYIWIKGDLKVENPVICNKKYDVRCSGLSDHYPISVQIHLF